MNDNKVIGKLVTILNTINAHKLLLLPKVVNERYVLHSTINN